MTEYLGYDAVIAINALVGGPGAGVLDANGIKGALGQPSQRWDGADLHPHVWEKAAVLLRGLAATQYFSDGNKRTAYVCAETFLNINGVKLRRIKPIYQEAFVRGVAAGAVGIGKASEWLATTETRGSRIRRHREPPPVFRNDEED